MTLDLSAERALIQEAREKAANDCSHYAFCVVAGLAASYERALKALELMSLDHVSVWVSAMGRPLDTLSGGEEECSCGQNWPCPKLGAVNLILKGSVPDAEEKREK